MWYTSSFSSSENLDCPVDLRFAAISLVFCIASLSNFTILYTITTQSHYEFVKSPDNLLWVNFCCLSGVISRGNAWKRRSCCWKAVETRGVSIVKVFKNAKMHEIAGFCIYNFKRFFRGDISGLPQAPLVLGPRHEFPLGSPAFLQFLFHQTTTAVGLKFQGDWRTTFTIVSQRQKDSIPITFVNNHLIRQATLTMC